MSEDRMDRSEKGLTHSAGHEAIAENTELLQRMIRDLESDVDRLFGGR